MREIRSHTALRGIAAFMVILFHYKIHLEYEGVIDAATGFLLSAEKLVDFFFILSGFVMAHVYLGQLDRPGMVRKYFISRFARIYPLHALTLTLMVGLLLYRGSSLTGDVQAAFVRNVFLLQAWGMQDTFMFNFPSWSISGEFAAYLAFPLLAQRLIKSARARASLAVLAVVAVLLEHYLVHTADLRWERLGLLRAGPLFALGVVLYTWRDNIACLSPTTLTTVQLTTLAVILLAMHLAADLIWFLPLFALLILATHTDEGMLPRLLEHPFLQGLGLISYTIYMMHVPVREVGYFIWPKISFLVPAAWQGSVFFLACLLATLGASILIYRLWEMPMRRLLLAKMSPARVSGRGT